jgi:hypothetical protein
MDSALYLPRSGIGVLAMLSFWGVSLVYKGIRGDIYDSFGEENAPRWAYIAFGLLCQAPLIAYLVFLRRSGWF